MINKGTTASELQFEAKEIFARYCNCAQATFLPFAIRYGISEEVASKIAQPFGGGMGHSGLVCGAISGGLLAIGLARGSADDDALKKHLCYHFSQTLISRFEALHGNTLCPRLLGYDLNNPIEKQRVYELNLYQNLCSKFVGDVVIIVSELLTIGL